METALNLDAFAILAGINGCLPLAPPVYWAGRERSVMCAVAGVVEYALSTVDATANLTGSTQNATRVTLAGRARIVTSAMMLRA